VTRHLNAFTGSFAVHVIAVAALIWFSAAAVRQGARGAAAVTKPVVELVPPLALLELDSRNAGTGTADDRLDVPHATGSTAIEIPNFSFDYGRIANRAAQLFPFVTAALLLDPIREVSARAKQAGLSNPYTTRIRASDKPPLTLSDEAAQALVDKIWSRRDRWPGFNAVAALMKSHDPDAGSLPAVVRRYREQNLLQPYVETEIRDPRLWTMLAIAADHTDFIGFATRYVAEHPFTRTATEMLFMLDDMAQGSRDAMLTLLDINPETDLWWTNNANRDARDLIVVLQRYYRTRLEQRGIGSKEGVQLLYDSVRLVILDAIVATTPAGYRAGDARFLLGSIYWSNGRLDDALRTWSEMTIDRTNHYAESSAAVLSALSSDTTRVDCAEINQILLTERRRWNDFWSGRLRKFGYNFETY